VPAEVLYFMRSRQDAGGKEQQSCNLALCPRDGRISKLPRQFHHRSSSREDPIRFDPANSGGVAPPAPACKLDLLDASA
jgi:hypothetical protein